MLKPELAPTILAENESFVVVDKPAGWLTVPGRADAPVLSAWLDARYGRIWTVHRLDRETSGVVLFARDEDAHRRASLAFEKRETRKFYRALARGAPMRPVFQIQSEIEGAPSQTQVEVQARFPEADVFLARVRILTGRRHQIRIHLSREGYPILGDPTYGGPKRLDSPGLPQGSPGLDLPRVALHAERLEWPGVGEWTAPLPPDFAGWIRALGGTP